jgi:putative flippase GtrA
VWSLAAIRYLTAGALSFCFDVGVLWMLHEPLTLPLAIATPVAFLASFVVTFTLQRLLAFRANNSIPGSVVKYAVLVAVNTVLTTAIVWGVAEIGAPWIVGKVAAVVVTTIGNYFVYRHWIFIGSKESTPRV